MHRLGIFDTSKCHRCAEEGETPLHLLSNCLSAIGPMTFSLTIQPKIDTLNCDLNIWYLDDVTLSDLAQVVYEDFQDPVLKSKEIGLEVNTEICELFLCSAEISHLQVCLKKLLLKFVLLIKAV